MGMILQFLYFCLLHILTLLSRPKCPQPPEPNNSNIYQGYLKFPPDAESEFDCLNLFIVRPSTEALKRAGINTSITSLPVLVWIHGGGFGFGAATDPNWGK